MRLNSAAVIVLALVDSASLPRDKFDPKEPVDLVQYLSFGHAISSGDLFRGVLLRQRLQGRDCIKPS